MSDRALQSRQALRRLSQFPMTPRRQLARVSASQPAPGLPPARRPGEPFNPYGLFNGIFVPEAVCRYRGLTLGAKAIYGRLCRYAGSDGAVFPSIPTLASELGIGKTQARKYVKELEGQYFIAVDRKNRHFTFTGAGGSNRYVFLWHVAFDGEGGKLRKSPPVRKTEGVPLRKTGPLPLRKTGGEENHHQESQEKESQAKRNFAGTPANFVPKAARAQKQHLLDSLSGDDDEKLLKPSPNRSAWEEVLTDFHSANQGAELSFQDECWIKEEMERRHTTPEALAELVKKNPLAGFDNPVAGLKWLVKRFRFKTRSSLKLETAAQRALGIILPLTAESVRCETCNNSGRVLERTEGQRPRVTDQYCNCRMGQELESAEHRVRNERPRNPQR